jgi:universal stress protein E
VDAEVVWERNRRAAWLRAVAERPYDLVVKDASVDGGRRGGLFHKPADWHLLRGADTPVCLVKPAGWSASPVVLASIDVEDTAHAALNRRIGDVASSLASALAGTLHFVHVYPALEEHMHRGVPVDYARIEANLRARCHADVVAFAAGFGVDAARAHVAGGRAEVHIPALARRIDAELCVLGTSAHTGFARFLIGSTAEEILHVVDTDIVTVPPPHDD